MSTSRKFQLNIYKNGRAIIKKWGHQKWDVLEIVTYITVELRKIEIWHWHHCASLDEMIRHIFMITSIGQFKLDLRSRSGHDPIASGGGIHVACQTKWLVQTNSLVPPASLKHHRVVMYWQLTTDDLTWPQMTFPGVPVNKPHLDHHRWDNPS